MLSDTAGWCLSAFSQFERFFSVSLHRRCEGTSAVIARRTPVESGNRVENLLDVALGTGTPCAPLKRLTFDRTAQRFFAPHRDPKN